ncbi:MAG: hypothetical protein LH614_01970 [Pyrinomonadaceae bacterium]|nr:hypothetical protein [Pyrinomonadaceae bacterium]
MKLNGLFFLVVIVLGVVVNDGCASKLSTQQTRSIAENTNDLEKLAGLQLLSSAKILSKLEEAAHDGTKFKRWIIAAAERFSLPETVIDGDDNQVFLKIIKEAIPNENVGVLVGNQYQFSDWRDKEGQWQAAIIETDRGFYLSLENIVLS